MNRLWLSKALISIGTHNKRGRGKSRVIAEIAFGCSRLSVSSPEDVKSSYAIVNVAVGECLS